MTDLPDDPTASDRPRPGLGRWTRRITVLAAALLVAAGVAPLVIRTVDGPPALETGSVPDDYALEVVGDGDTVDLATAGMGRVG